jgi:hypothetical protein
VLSPNVKRLMLCTFKCITDATVQTRIPSQRVTHATKGHKNTCERNTGANPSGCNTDAAVGQEYM